MDERTKLIWTVVAFLVVLAVEIYLCFAQYQNTKALRAENTQLDAKNKSLLADIAKIPAMKKELAQLEQNDALFARMIPDSKEYLKVIDFIGQALERCGAKLGSYKEIERRQTRRKGPSKDYETHSWEVKFTGTFEQFVSFVNQFEYHGLNDSYMRFFSIPSFTVRQTSDDSLVNDCVVQIDEYSMTSTDPKATKK